MRTPSQVAVEIAGRLSVDLPDVRNPRVTTIGVIRARRLIAYVLRVEQNRSWGDVSRAIGVTRRACRRLCRYTSEKPESDLASYLGRDA